MPDPDMHTRPLVEILDLPLSHPTAALRRDLLTRLPLPSPDSVATVTFLAGAGTRWKASLENILHVQPHDAALARLASTFPSDAPRGLFPVPDFITGKGSVSVDSAYDNSQAAVTDGSTSPSHTIAMAAYAVDAVKGLGHMTLVIRGWQDAIIKEVLEPLGIALERVRFCTQRPGPGGAVLGHGDAALQCRSFWEDSTLVVTNFGGDANSPLTVRIALGAMRAFEEKGIEIGALIPVAWMDAPGYPVYLDERGIPTGFWHAKLAGSPPPGAPSNFTNVGIRIYRSEWLARALDTLHDRYWDHDSGWNIPSNDPSKHECALDNVDALLASWGKVRVLPVAMPAELTPLKALTEYDGFLNAVREVRREWEAVRMQQRPEDPI